MTQRINENNAVQEDDAIDLLQLWQTLVKNKWLILLSSFCAAVLAAGISLLMPNIYRADVLLAPVSAEGAKGGGLASALGGLGGLASMAGISIGGGGGTEVNLAVLKSRDFLWAFVQEKKLMPILFEDGWDAQKNTWIETDPKKQPGQMDVYRLFNEGGLMSVAQDKKTELVTLSIVSKDAQFSAELANMLVESVNHYLSQQAIARSESNLKYLNEELMRTPVEEMRKTLFDLIANEQKSAMLANTQKAFAFKVLDSAVEPDKKIKPKRSLIVILAAFVAGFMAILFVFIREGIAKRRDTIAYND
ncbi:MAG: Wzz/FepE/Etk N-terminal domain-containing protein [Sideroxydans sp.]